MSTLLYDLSVAPILRSLKHLDAIVSKAEEHLAADEGIEPATFINARLHPNMAPFVFQIRVATDTAKGVAARLSQTELPSWPDNEKTFAEVHERLHKAIDFLSKFKAEDFTGAEELDITLKLGPYTVNFDGASYVANFVMPNFYFHMTTAYNILRHNGVALGKVDYLGAI